MPLPPPPPSSAKIQLHRNELPFDWPIHIKQRIATAIAAEAWNRYPSSHGVEINALIAKHYGLAPDQVQVGPGGNFAVRLALAALAPKASKVVVLRPSFPLYTTVCSQIGTTPEFWDLNDQYEFDVETMPALIPGSLIILASPNNPTGSVLPRNTLVDLLKSHRDSTFIVDCAYDCFEQQNLHALLGEHPNLVTLDTLTKSYGTAVARCGFVAGPAEIVGLVRKHQPQFMMNPMTLHVFEAVFSDTDLRKHVETERAHLIQRRDLFAEDLRRISGRNFEIRNSPTNFVILKWANATEATRAMEHLLADRILVVNCSQQPKLEGWLRISIGTDEEMAAVVASLQRLSA